MLGHHHPGQKTQNVPSPSMLMDNRLMLDVLISGYLVHASHKPTVAE